MKFVLILALCFHSLFAQVAPEMTPPLLNAYFDKTDPKSGDTLFLNVTIDPKWHITADHTDDEFAYPCKTVVKNPKIEFHPALYPDPLLREVPELNLVASEFAGTILIKIPIAQTHPESSAEDTEIAFTYQACSNSICLAPATVKFTFKQDQSSEPPSPQGLEKKKSPTFWFLLIGAFLGGLILNLMPCVLPVLSLKIYHLIDKAKEKGKGSLSHGIAFSLGILISLQALAIAILILRRAGESVGWGFQLQNPYFLIFLTFLLLVFSLNLFGLIEFSLPMSANRNATRLSNAQGYLGSFLSGAFLTLIATPCSAPFMGSAIGYALSLPTAEVLAIFSALGLGLAMPYLLLAAFPSWMRFLPKPGPWMNTLKHFTGFILLASIGFLLWVLEALAPEALFPTLFFLWISSLIIWVLGFYSGYEKTPTTRWTARILSLLLLGGLYTFTLHPYLTTKIETRTQEESSETWQEFTPELLESKLQKKERVFIDFTARWCLTCQLNKKKVLHTTEVQKLFHQNKVQLIQADWTAQDPAITKQLEKYNRSSVPVYAYYSEKGELTILPEILSLEDIEGLFAQDHR